MQVAAIYTPNYNGTGTTPGRYVIMGGFEWLITPIKRSYDTIALYTGQFNWKDKIDGDDSNYSLLIGYRRNTYDSSDTTCLSYIDILDTRDEDSATVTNSAGVYFQYHLPKDVKEAHIKYDHISFLITGVCEVQDINAYSLAVDAEYVHIKNSSLIVPTVQLDSIIGIDISRLLLPTEYKTSHSWLFADDKNK